MKLWFKFILGCVLPIIFILTAMSCTDTAPQETEARQARLIIPEAGEGIILSSVLEEEQEPEYETDTLSAPKIRIPDTYTTINVFDTNLDLDAADEQIISYKKQDDGSDAVHISVLDFDSIRESYQEVWSAQTLATNMRTFSVYLKDLIGDHEKEIVCFGMDSEGRQTMNAYKKTNSPYGFGLYYASIISLVSDGTIEIDESDRSTAYQAHQRSGRSFPIITNRHDLDSNNVLDLIRTTYYWKNDENRYIKGREEKIPGLKIEEEQLGEIINGDEKDFENFLYGPWYRSTGNEKAEDVEIIYFNPLIRNITLYSGNIQESYIWESSHKTISQSLYISMVNESIKMIREDVSISLINIDTVLIRIRGNEDWNGTYNKLRRSLQETLVNNNDNEIRPADMQLSGTFKNEGGVELNFSYPYFTLIEDGKEKRGGYVLYHLDDFILEMKMLSPNGLVTETRTYQLQYTEEVHDERILRIIDLTEAEIDSTGIKSLGEGNIKLEQIVRQENP
jgi:hypothetical protein